MGALDCKISAALPKMASVVSGMADGDRHQKPTLLLGKQVTDARCRWMLSIPTNWDLQVI